MSRPVIEVVVALLADGQGRWLLNQRPAGRPLAGFWEFPGGKREPGEEPWPALRRELAEELGITAVAGRPVLAFDHDYPERRVRLDVWRVSRYVGVPSPREGQCLRWLTIDDIPTLPLLEADWPIVSALRELAVGAVRDSSL